MRNLSANAFKAEWQRLDSVKLTGERWVSLHKYS